MEKPKLIVFASGTKDSGGGGVWEFTVHPGEFASEKTNDPPHDFEETYARLRFQIMLPYSDRAFRAHLTGDLSLIKAEIQEKNKLVEHLLAYVESMGITLQFTPYQE